MTDRVSFSDPLNQAARNVLKRLKAPASDPRFPPLLEVLVEAKERDLLPVPKHLRDKVENEIDQAVVRCAQSPQAGKQWVEWLTKDSDGLPNLSRYDLLRPSPEEALTKVAHLFSERLKETQDNYPSPSPRPNNPPTMVG